MRIIIDAMSGDNAPLSPIQGALDALKTYDTEITLVGHKKVLGETLGQLGVVQPIPGLHLVHAPQTITMEDNPSTAFKEKKGASMVVGLNLLRDGEGDAFVSAGNTGALLTASTMIVKRIRGIRRAGLAPVLPGVGTVLIDCGATIEGKPEYLLQYAFMGSFYAHHVLCKPHPRVGLLNCGGEAGKGTPLQLDTYALLQKAAEQGQLNFVGNFEASDLTADKVDVIVSDGFSGNVLMKTMEGTGKLAVHLLKDLFNTNGKTKMAYLLLKDHLGSIVKTLDANEIGGTPLLGLNSPVIKAHGASNAYAIQNAVRQAIAFASSGFIDSVRENIPNLKVSVAQMTVDRVLRKGE